MGVGEACRPVSKIRRAVSMKIAVKESKRGNIAAMRKRLLLFGGGGGRGGGGEVCFSLSYDNTFFLCPFFICML